MEIKTVYYQAGNGHNEEFDRRVNEALDDGFVISEIKIITTDNTDRFNMLYALLKKEEREVSI